MSTVVQKFHDLLRQNGRSITTSRTLLFQYLQQSGPVSPRQFMLDNASVADRASLYRALDLFRRLGVVEDRIITGKRLVELTDAYDSHHHHLTCERCGSSIALEMPDIEAALVRLSHGHGFRVSNHTIEASGLCNVCQMTETHSLEELSIKNPSKTQLTK